MHEICLHTLLSTLHFYLMLRTLPPQFLTSTFTSLHLIIPLFFLFQSCCSPSFTCLVPPHSFFSSQYTTHVANRLPPSTFFYVPPDYYSASTHNFLLQPSYVQPNPTTLACLLLRRVVRSFVRSFFCTHTVSCRLLLSASSRKHPLFDVPVEIA